MGIDKPKKVLALGAHPDDLEIGCGGALIKHVNFGDEVYLYVATKGERGGDPQIREREMERSAEKLGAKDLIWGNFIDCEVPDGLPLIKNVEQAVKAVDPDIVFVHYTNDTHQDHRALAMAAQSAARRVPRFLFYESPSTQHFLPSVYIDISEEIVKKIDLLECHFSQTTRTNIEGLPIMDIARGVAIRRGIEVYKNYAESFLPARFLLM